MAREREAQISRLTASMMCNKSIRSLSPVERKIVVLLEEGGYIKPSSNGFVGPCTNKVLSQAKEDLSN